MIAPSHPTAQPVRGVAFRHAVRALRLYESCGSVVSKREATYPKPLD